VFDRYFNLTEKI